MEFLMKGRLCLGNNLRMKAPELGMVVRGTGDVQPPREGLRGGLRAKPLTQHPPVGLPGI